MAQPAHAATHVSQTQSAGNEKAVHEDLNPDVLFEEQSSLPLVAARKGYDQRWVRISVRGEDDMRNVYNSRRKGWEPRSPTTIPSTLKWMAIKKQGVGNVIGTHDCVLMERKVEISDVFNRKVDEENRSRLKAVKQTVFRDHSSLDPSGQYVTRPQFEESARVERGSGLQVQDD